MKFGAVYLTLVVNSTSLFRVVESIWLKYMNSIHDTLNMSQDENSQSSSWKLSSLAKSLIFPPRNSVLHFFLLTSTSFSPPHFVLFSNSNKQESEGVEVH